jgi:flagellar hook-length control protein FliK
MVSAIARDDGDEVTPGFKLGHEPQMATDGPKATLEPPRSSSVQPVDSQPGERHFRNGDGHDRPVARRPQETPLEALRDSPALAGAPMPPGYEIQQDSAPLSKWRPTVERLADDIVSHARLGRTEAVLQLDPPELGKIKIDLRLEDGKLQARIIAEGHDSKQLLEAHLPELRQALAAGRLDVIDVRVSQGNGSGLSGDLSQNFQRSPQGQQGSDRNSFHPLPPTPPESPPGQRRTGREAGRVSMWA